MAGTGPSSFLQLSIDMVDPARPEFRKDIHILDFSPGEPFGISALLFPDA